MPKNHESYWKRPELARKGDVSPDAIYSGIGQALTTWEASVEDSFAKLFGVLLSGSGADFYSAVAVYGMLAAKNARIDAINAAKPYIFRDRKVTDTDQKILGLLLNHYAEAANRRNDIAHSMVQTHMRAGSFLVPPGHATRWNVAGKIKLERGHPHFGHTFIYCYTSEDILSFRDKFRNLSAWVGDYINLLIDKYPKNKIKPPSPRARSTR